jgi:hypothetical protein
MRINIRVAVDLGEKGIDEADSTHMITTRPVALKYIP